MKTLKQALKEYPISKLTAMVRELTEYNQLHFCHISNHINAQIVGFALTDNENLLVDIVFKKGRRRMKTEAWALDFFMDGTFSIESDNVEILFKDEAKTQLIYEFVRWYEMKKAEQ